MMTNNNVPLDQMDPARVVPLPKVAEFLGVSQHVLLKNYAEQIIRISDRRRGMRVRDVLKIGEKSA